MMSYVILASFFCVHLTTPLSTDKLMPGVQLGSAVNLAYGTGRVLVRTQKNQVEHFVISYWTEETIYGDSSN